MHKGCSSVLFSEKLIALFIIHKTTQNGTWCFSYFLSLAYFYFLRNTICWKDFCLFVFSGYTFWAAPRYLIQLLVLYFFLGICHWVHVCRVKTSALEHPWACPLQAWDLGLISLPPSENTDQEHEESQSSKTAVYFFVMFYPCRECAALLSLGSSGSWVCLGSLGSKWVSSRRDIWDFLLPAVPFCTPWGARLFPRAVSILFPCRGLYSSQCRQQYKAVLFTLSDE